MDATYWGRNFGVVIMKDFRTGKIIWRKFIFLKETFYPIIIEFQIEGIVCNSL
jgi:hypothetical protein